MKPTTETKAFADQHPRYRDLCTLPGGTVIAKTTAVARGYILRGGAATTPSRPLPASVAAIPPRPVAPPVPAVVADRARCQSLIDMTAKGSAEAEAECREAIRVGTSPAAYQATVAARSILIAMEASGQARR